MKGELKQFGFDPSLVKIDETHWTLGSIASVILKEDGDWSAFLPIYEPQAQDYETWACTCYGSLNQIEILLKFLEGKEYNFAERYPYNGVGINPPGANPHDVYEWIRKQGTIPQEVLPRPINFESFKYPRPMIQTYADMGLKWLQDYEFNHEWIMNPTHEDIASALKFSPIALSVTAWFFQNDLAVDANQLNTHWACAFKAYPDGRIDVFDSYDHSVKTLDPKHKIQFAKRISILNKKKVIQEIQEPSYPKKHYWFIEIFLNLWQIIASKFSNS